MWQYVWKYLLPGVSLIVVGFLVGSQPNIMLGLFAFLPFFTIGVVLIVEGYKKSFSSREKS